MSEADTRDSPATEPLVIFALLDSYCNFNTVCFEFDLCVWVWVWVWVWEREVKEQDGGSPGNHLQTSFAKKAKAATSSILAC